MNVRFRVVEDWDNDEAPPLGYAPTKADAPIKQLVVDLNAEGKLSDARTAEIIRALALKFS